MIACCALWGGNTVAVKRSVPAIPPFGCAAIRFLLSLPILAIICASLGQPLRVRRPLWWLLGLHALVTVVQIGTFNWGTSHGLAGRSSVFINIHPLVVAPLAWLLLGERMGMRGLLGLGSAAAGVSVLLVEPLQRGQLLVGDLVVLGSGIVFGFQTIAQKLTFPLIPPATLLLLQTVLAIPLFLLYSGLFEGFATYQPTADALWGVLYQGLAVSGICFTTWMVLLRRYQAGHLAALAFLTPLFGVAFGNLFQGEPVTTSLVVGGCLVGSGIVLVASDRTAHGKEPDIGLPGEDAP